MNFTIEEGGQWNFSIHYREDAPEVDVMYLRVTVYHNGNQLQLNRSFDLLNGTGKFVINNATLNDSGTYTFEVMTEMSEKLQSPAIYLTGELHSLHLILARSIPLMGSSSSLRGAWDFYKAQRDMK